MSLAPDASGQGLFAFAQRDLMDMPDDEFYWSVRGIDFLRDDVRTRHHALPRVKRENAEMRQWAARRPKPVHPVLVVPNEWNHAFHVTQGAFTWHHEDRPPEFTTIQAASDWAEGHGVRPGIDHDCLRWLRPWRRPCGACLAKVHGEGGEA